MITNERQYRIAKAELKRFEEAVSAQRGREPSADVHPRLHAAMGDALASEVEELRAQLSEYERLRDGRVRSRMLRSLRDLPRALIEARIARRMTQKGLADRLGVAEQQVQRWEATGYSGVSVERLQDVADALGLEISKRLSFAPAGRAARRSRRSTAAPRRADPRTSNAGKRSPKRAGKSARVSKGTRGSRETASRRSGKRAAG